MRNVMAAAILLSLATLAAAQRSAPPTASGADWDYQGKKGALVWGKLDPAYKACAQGHAQSPVDIRGAHLNKTLPALEFHYIATPVRLENNGRTILVHVDPGSYVVIGGVRYDLIEYDFHHPSETAVHGKLSDMEIHLLHRSADGKQIIVAIRLAEDISTPNAVLAALWPHLPKTAGASEKVEEMVSAAGLLPADRGYWTYDGSLSTPPCTEGVRWFVLVQELGLSRDQLRAFGLLFKINTRPLQDAHGRRLEANE
jgi:carbonic anhydrase